MTHYGNRNYIRQQYAQQTRKVFNVDIDALLLSAKTNTIVIKKKKNPCARVNQWIRSAFEQKNDAPRIIEYNPLSFWQIIRKIRCVDRDDGRMSRNSIRLNENEKNICIRGLQEIVIPTLTSMEIPHIAMMSDKDRINFCSHVAAKGLDFYTLAVSMPDISLYLVNNTYPIFDWLNSP